MTTAQVALGRCLFSITPIGSYSKNELINSSNIVAFSNGGPLRKISMKTGRKSDFRDKHFLFPECLILSVAAITGEKKNCTSASEQIATGQNLHHFLTANNSPS